MKKIAIVSGKGGVGKSMIASSLAILFSEFKKIVALDCDVDAPNLAVWLGEPEDWEDIEKISVSEKPEINNQILKKYSLEEKEKCVQKCRFKALEIRNRNIFLNPFLCEGCGACEFFCPSGAVKMKPIFGAEVRTKITKYNFPLISGHLFPGEIGSGKIVSEIKKRGELFNLDLMIIDSAPGTGCPVVSSLQGCDFAILVTEPSRSGFSDLKRVLKVVNHFKIEWGLIINKWDINFRTSSQIEKWGQERVLGKTSYNQEILKSISNLVPIMESSLPQKKEVKKIFKKLLNLI